MLLYYITDRRALAGGHAEQRRALLRRIAEAARAGVDYIQLREKDLSPRDLERLAKESVRAVRENSGQTKLLINSHTDVALACDADGVHLPAGELSASEVRTVWRKRSDREALIGASAHSVTEVRSAQAELADFAVLAPIFEKVQTNAGGIGLEVLEEACTDVQTANLGGFLLLALGGINVHNAPACLKAGAGGIAGIRVFQVGDVAETVRRLRDLDRV